MAGNAKIEIINFLKSSKKGYSSKKIHESISSTISYATVKRIITELVSENIITKTGKGKSTKYSISIALEIVLPVDIEKYYEKEIDEREIKYWFLQFRKLF
jgi:predicted transcriptional regulator